MIPTDPVILLSYVNTKLRDYYDSIEQLCEELSQELSKESSLCRRELEQKLAGIGYYYDRARNQFI